MLCRAAENGWSLPPDWNKNPSGLYYGDRSMFGVMIDDQKRSIVNNPGISWGDDRTDAGKDEYGRCFMAANSEVGDQDYANITLSSTAVSYRISNLATSAAVAILYV